MTALRIAGGRRIDTGRVCDIAVTNGRIQAVPEGVETTVLDASGLWVSPGFVDLQINGAFGSDFTTEPETIWTVAAGLVRYGVTAFLPTLVSPEPATVRAAAAVLAAGPPAGWAGAVPLGLHCEGPMINPVRRGVHPAGSSRAPSPALIESWGGLDHVRMVTLAPELDGAQAVTELLVAAGVVVAAGHTDASIQVMRASFTWGVSHATHLFNAMSGVDHRHPGAATAFLADDTTTIGLIADGHHVHPDVVALVVACRGSAAIALTTDAIAALGTTGSTFALGSADIDVAGGVARGPDGQLAGSVLSMDQAVRNLCDYADIGVDQACSCASVTPAAVLADSTRGRLDSNARADLVLMNDSAEVVATVVGGEVLYERPS